MQKLVARCSLLVAGCLTLAWGGFIVESTASAQPIPSSAAAVDPEAFQILSADAPLEHRFEIALPVGSKLEALSPDKATGETAENVLIVGSDGNFLGAYDSAWATDSRGRPVPTTYRVAGASLVQRIIPTADVSFPVTLDPIYSPTPSEFEQSQPLTPSAKARVTIPANYVYNPKLGSLHDYCTMSPDEFPAPAGKNADFRGPCARHDICYGGRTDKKVCDVNLLSNMRTNCEAWYGTFNPNRQLCYNTAAVYFGVVVGAS